MVTLAVLAGLMGAAIGSFLNVCIYRWPLDESVVAPRSHCPRCGQLIAWYDNVPVLSWLLLRGKCRTCGEPISVQYPVVELATALLWAASAARFGVSVESLRMAVFLTILLGIALTDAQHYIIPNEFSLGGLVLGLALAALSGGLPLLHAVEGAALGLGLLWLIGRLGQWAFHKPAMGGGDVKMMAMVGAFVGPLGVVLTIFLGALSGTLIFGPISWKTGKLVPFGIFLALGAAITFIWGPDLISWYVRVVLQG